MKIKRRLAILITNLIAWLISAICLCPLLLLLFNSFKDKASAAKMDLHLPTLPLQWENFSTVIEKGKLAQSFMNSTIYSVCSVIICVILAAMASYVLSRNRSRLHNVIYFYLVLGITLPINYVALMKVMQTLHLNNTRFGIILLYVAMQLPFTVFLIYGFISKISVEIDEAAILDGCGPYLLFFEIIFPLLKPVLATAVVLVFLNTWNEFVSPLYFLSSSTQWPMTLAVYNFFGMYEKSWNLVCADIVLTTLPVLVVYLLGQKYIVTGMTAGAVKG